MIAPLTECFFEGFNATVLAYGQTGSGKSYTMGSSDYDAEGIIPFAVQDFFSKKAELEETGAVVEMFMSYLEIYNEKCYDLLSTAVVKEKAKENVPKSATEERPCLGNVWDNARGETILEGLSNLPVPDQNEAARY